MVQDGARWYKMVENGQVAATAAWNFGLPVLLHLSRYTGGFGNLPCHEGFQQVTEKRVADSTSILSDLSTG